MTFQDQADKLAQAIVGRGRSSVATNAKKAVGILLKVYLPKLGYLYSPRLMKCTQAGVFDVRLLFYP